MVFDYIFTPQRCGTVLASTLKTRRAREKAEQIEERNEWEKNRTLLV